MGHIRLGRLPRTQKWREVVDLVEHDGSAAQVADATVDAAEGEFFSAASDPVVVHTVWLLTQLPDAARSEDFAGALRELGIDVSADPSSTELAAAVGRAVDHFAQVGASPRTDIGEIARLAAVEALADLARDDSPSLFGPVEGDVQAKVGRIATQKQFGEFARDFFARMTERVLTYYVSKELPRHVGEGHRFQTLDEQRDFQDAVALHARQAARIVETFAGGWYSKARFEKDLTPERTGRFVAYAMKKMRRELRRGAV